MSRLTSQLAVGSLILIIGVPAVVGADPISVYVAPDNTYQNTANDPCVFYGPGTCPVDPAGWPPPEGDTNGDFGTLTQTYSGADFTSWLDVVGSSFFLGLDVNDTGTSQTLNTFTIEFFDSTSSTLGSYTLGSPLDVPSVSNGTGYADYVLAAGCSGTVTVNPGIDACSDYTPFVLPGGTASLTMQFGYTGGNDGPDKVFAISGATSVPEPASVGLFAIGLLALSAGRRLTKVA